VAAVSSILTIASALSDLAAKQPNQLVWVDAEGRLVIGPYPEARAIYDFIYEAITPTVAGPDASERADRREAIPEPAIIDLRAEAGRLRATYDLRVGGKVFRVGSLKQALIVGLEGIEDLKPGTLTKLALETKRSKRVVATRRDDLYATPHPESHSHKMRNEYYVATNNNESEVRDFLNKAAELAGLRGGEFEFRWVG